MPLSGRNTSRRFLVRVTTSNECRRRSTSSSQRVCLFWIEVLSLTGNLDVGTHAIHDVDQWYQSVSCVGYLSKHMFMCVQAGLSCKWTNDSQRLIVLNFDQIRRSPVQLYWCALPFCPSSSWLHERYRWSPYKGSKWSRGGRTNGEDVLAQSSLDHTFASPRCYKDIVTVGLSSGDIFVLDAITGTHRSGLSGHTGTVNPSLSHLMEHCSYPEVEITVQALGRPDRWGCEHIPTVTPLRFSPFPSHQTPPQSLQDLLVKFVCGTFGRENVASSGSGRICFWPIGDGSPDLPDAALTDGESLVCAGLRCVEEVTLQAEKGNATTVDSFGRTLVWNLSTGAISSASAASEDYPPLLFETGGGSFQSPDVRSDEHRLAFTHVAPIGGRTWPRVVDTITNNEVFRLPEIVTNYTKLQWDGRYLFFIYNSTPEVFILDFVHMIPR
jgi:hypothetical protein